MRTPLVVLALLAAVLMTGLLLLPGCGPRTADDLPEPTELSGETTETIVYFSTGRSLMGEVRVIDRTAPYEDALRTLLDARPESNTEVAIVQPVAGYSSVTFEDGTVTIDWQADVLDFEADDAEERLAYAAILATYGAFPEVERVRFLVEGAEEGMIEGKDVAAFWGSVSLNGQPWDVIRVKGPDDSDMASETVAP
jgi:hypothetical protein